MPELICKFKDVESKEIWNKDLEELKQCGCARCTEAYKQKDYARLQAFENEVWAQKEAEQRGVKWAQMVEQQLSKYEEELDTRSIKTMEQYLKSKGINLDMLSKAPFFRRLEQSTSFDVPGKNVYVNRGISRGKYSEKEMAYEKYLRFGDISEYKAVVALSEATGAQGGYLAPNEFLARIIEKRDEMSVLRRAGADVLMISAESVDIPVEDGRGSGAWLADGSSISGSSTSPTFKQVTLIPKIYGQLIPVSRKLLNDQGVDILAYLSRMFGRVFGLALDGGLINGSGTGNEPKGILNDTGVPTQAVADGTGKLVAKDLIDIMYKIPHQYHERVVWLMNQRTAQKIRSLADGNNRYLWDISRGGLTEGQPATILGRPVYITNQIPNDDTNGDKLVLGDFSYFTIVESQTLEIARSDDYYFDTNQVAMRGLMYVDGAVTQTEAFATLTGIKSI